MGSAHARRHRTGYRRGAALGPRYARGGSFRIRNRNRNDRRSRTTPALSVVRES